jgi:hypothetical protein
MTRRNVVLVLALLAVVTVMSVMVTTQPGAEGSVLSSAPRGLLLARRYLEERGTPVQLLDAPFTETAPRPVLVVAFPWQRHSPVDDLSSIHTQVRAGTTLVYGFSGASLALAEDEFLEAIGLPSTRPRGRAPLSPAHWRSFAAASWTLVPVVAGARPLVVRAPWRVPVAPEGAHIWYRAEATPSQADGVPMVFSYEVGRGRVIVLPAEVLSNAGLPQGSSLDLLETLRQTAPGPWTFDEFHHGLSAPASPVQAESRRVLDLYLLQLALLYGLAVLALVRRFGPAWSDPPQVLGSAGTFLTGLGALHDRLGHHPAAARLLVARARELHPHLVGSPPATPKDGSARSLVALARAIAGHQRQLRRTR